MYYRHNHHILIVFLTPKEQFQMNLQKFTLKSQEALQTAQEIAANYNNQAIEPIHLLAALIQDSAGIIQPMLMKLGANMSYLKIKINEQLESLPKIAASATANHYLSTGLSAVMESSLKEATAMKDEYVSVEHLLIALTEQKSNTSQLLKDQGVIKEFVLKILSEFRGNQRVTDQNPEDKYQALHRYGRILNDEARKGKIDPVIGREDEVRRVLQVLSRRTKNNPILCSKANHDK